MSTIERLPVRTRPGFDCRNDHANCPACKAQGEADHGICGGSAWYVVRGEHDGRRVALVLEVLRKDFPATAIAASADKSWYSRPPMGATLSIHNEQDAGDKCDWLDGHLCQSEVWSFIGADEFYKTWGNPDPKAAADDQHENFWLVLEAKLRAHLEHEPVLS